MTRLEQMQALLSQACEMHDMDVFWVNETQTLYDAIDSQILAPLEARIAELEANTAKQEKLLQTHVGLTHSWTVLAAGQARRITELETEIDRLRQQELGVVDSGNDEDDE